MSHEPDPVIGARYDRHTGEHVPTLNGKDAGVTTFGEERALELARQIAERGRELTLFVAIHYHRHGVSVFPFRAHEIPDEETLIETFDIDFEPDTDESIDIIECGTRIPTVRCLPKTPKPNEEERTNS